MSLTRQKQFNLAFRALKDTAKFNKSLRDKDFLSFMRKPCLAEFLNSIDTDNDVKRIGGSSGNTIDTLKWMAQTGEVWGAMLREGSPQGHAVLICGDDENGLIIIKDPFDQTEYKMNVDDLYDVLSEIVWRKKLK